MRKELPPRSAIGTAMIPRKPGTLNSYTRGFFPDISKTPYVRWKHHHETDTKPTAVKQKRMR